MRVEELVMALIKPDKPPQHSASFALSTNQSTTYALRRQSFSETNPTRTIPTRQKECSPTKYPSPKQPLASPLPRTTPSPGSYARNLPNHRKWSRETCYGIPFLRNPASFNRKTETRFKVPALVQLKFPEYFQKVFQNPRQPVSLQQDSNLRPTDYDSAALPTELWRVRNT